ncbi:DNA alkylation repair protein [Photobacterium leiognathi]|uniref:DNA alkylation repair protein n=1 Tax=Photobacterium leiognathi TaxID=553611 RepID=UPI0027387A27|nr:DNA alkylation repair protein [Photobacterium leiognathi]
MSFVIPMVIYMQQHLAQSANKTVAAQMQSSLSVKQPCYGISTEQRHDIFQLAVAHTTIDTADNYHRLLLWLWSGVYREERYLALDAGEYYQSFINEQAWPIYTEMLETVDGVDVGDRLVTNLISPVLKQHRQFESDVIAWRDSDNKWLRRASLLAQMNHQTETNVDLLCDTILHLADDSEYEVQQAIGLALRNYSETDFPLVDQFIKTHFSRLQSQARREARKVSMVLSVDSE